MDSTDIKYYRGTRTTTAATNGGRRNVADQITSGTSEAVWDKVREAQRVAETEEWEKIFPSNMNSDNEVGYSPKIYFDGDPVSGDDWSYFIPATQQNYESDIAGTEQKYVAGALTSAVDTTATSITVTVKNAIQAAAFFDTGTLRLQSARYASSPTVVDVVVDGSPSVSDLEVTLTLSEAIGTAFSAGALVSMVYLPDFDVEPTVDNTSYTGGADIDSSLIGLDNQGTIEQEYVLTVNTGAATFTIVGDTLGTLSTSGTIGSEYAPQNSDTSTDLFVLPSSIFDGLTVSAGDTFTFQTHPAGVPVFLYKNNPASATKVNSNSFTVVMEYEY